MKYSTVILQSQMVIVLSLSTHFTFADNASCSLQGSTYKCEGINAVYDQAHLNYDDVVIINTAASAPSGTTGYGVYVNGPLTAQKHLTVIAGNSNSEHTDAIVTSGNASLTVKGKLVVEAYGRSADAIHASRDSNSIIKIGNNSDIYSEQGVGVRADLALSSGQSNDITIGEGVKIHTAGYGNVANDIGGYAVFAGYQNDARDGVFPYGTAKIVIGDNSDISTEGTFAHAVYANKTARIQLGSTVIKTSGYGANGINAEASNVIDPDTLISESYTGGKVDLLSDVTIDVSGEDSYAMYANGREATIASRNMDDLDENNQPKNTSGVFDVKGDMLANNGGLIDLRMNDGSRFIGNTELDTESKINLNITGANSFWQMSHDSQVTDLTLHGNNVFLGDQHVPINASNKVTLTVTNLSGEGIFHMRTNIADKVSDLLSVGYIDSYSGDVFWGTSSGNHSVQVSDYSSGGAAVDGSERLMLVNQQLVKDKDANATFHLVNDYVDVGAYQYELVPGDTSRGEGKNDWYLAKTNKLTHAADSSVNVLNINYLLNYVETQTSLQRMGALRQSRDDIWDVWARGFAGRLSSFSGKLSGFDVDYRGFQAGIDRRFIVNDDDLYVGVMAGTAKAKADYKIGHGDTTSYHVGIYGTYKTQNDFYVDVIAKYVVMKNDFNTQTGGGYQVNGDGTTRGYTLGLEAGKRFYFNKVKAGWYIEPQAQLTYSHQNGTNIHSSNGLKTKLDAYDSMLGRASAIVGYNISEGNTPIDVYLKTGYVKELDGKTSYTFNDNARTKTNYKFDSSWWDNGVGINAQINKKHNIYLEAGYAKGNRFDNKSIELGYRLSF